MWIEWESPGFAILLVYAMIVLALVAWRDRK